MVRKQIRLPRVSCSYRASFPVSIVRESTGEPSFTVSGNQSQLSLTMRTDGSVLGEASASMVKGVGVRNARRGSLI